MDQADWTDVAAYAPLLDADRSIFAWEWLRRDQDYCAAAQQARRGKRVMPERWGLHAFEAPDQAAPEARPLWRAKLHPFVLPVTAEPPARAADSFDPASFGKLITCVAAVRGEHLLISDGLRTLRLDVQQGTLAHGPARLRYHLAGFASAEEPLLTLRRLLALRRTGRFSKTLHRREAKARRWVLMLRASDALAAGASQRAIAETLFSSRARTPRWRSAVPSLRSQAQRLVQAARGMAGGGYRELLR